MKKEIIAYITAVCNIYSRRLANEECAVTVSVLKDMDDVIDFIQDLDETQTDTSATTFLNVVAENEQLKRRCAELEECREYAGSIEAKLRANVKSLSDANSVLQTTVIALKERNECLSNNKTFDVVNLMTSTLYKAGEENEK